MWLPKLVFDVEFKENEYKIREDIKKEIVTMFPAANSKDLNSYEEASDPGLGYT